MGIGKLSFVSRWVLGISLVCLVPLVPRFRWSRWLSFSSCFAGVLRDPLPPKPVCQSPCVRLCQCFCIFHASAYPSNAFAYSHALAYADACPKVIIELSRLFCLATYFVNSKWLATVHIGTRFTMSMCSELFLWLLFLCLISYLISSIMFQSFALSLLFLTSHVSACSHACAHAPCLCPCAMPNACPCRCPRNFKYLWLPIPLLLLITIFYSSPFWLFMYVFWFILISLI